jgi:hypothetical protein
MRLLSGLVLLLATASTLAAAATDIDKLKGKYKLWEDFEGGKVCDVTLETEPTIGGHVFKGNERCMKPFKLSGDPSAWFLDQQGSIAIIDATRKVLVRFKRTPDGSYYAVRATEGLENLNLTRP